MSADSAASEHRRELLSLRESVEASGKQAYLQPWFVERIIGLIDVAEAADELTRFLGQNGVPDLRVLVADVERKLERLA